MWRRLTIIIVTNLLVVGFGGGCVKVQVDKPLVEFRGESTEQAAPDDGEQGPAVSLRRELARCQARLAEKVRACEVLEDKLESCNEQVKELEERLEELQEQRGK